MEIMAVEIGLTVWDTNEYAAPACQEDYGDGRYLAHGRYYESCNPKQRCHDREKRWQCTDSW